MEIIATMDIVKPKGFKKLMKRYGRMSVGSLTIEVMQHSFIQSIKSKIFSGRDAELKQLLHELPITAKQRGIIKRQITISIKNGNARWLCTKRKMVLWF